MTTNQTAQEIRDIYGEWFCEKIGIENLLNMPVVTPKSIGLIKSTYYECLVKVDNLKGHIAVRGIDELNRPFVAIRFSLEISDQTGELKTKEFVEVLHKRYSNNGSGGKGQIFEDNYVSALTNTCADGTTVPSYFYRDGRSDFKQLKNYFNGEEILTSFMKQDIKDYS